MYVGAWGTKKDKWLLRFITMHKIAFALSFVMCLALRSHIKTAKRKLNIQIINQTVEIEHIQLSQEEKQIERQNKTKKECMYDPVCRCRLTPLKACKQHSLSSICSCGNMQLLRHFRNQLLTAGRVISLDTTEKANGKKLKPLRPSSATSVAHRAVVEQFTQAADVF